MEVDGEGPSLPSNYVTILQLKERWLQQQNQQNPPKSYSDSQLNPHPNHDSAPEIPNKPLHRIRHRHRAPNHLKPQVTVHDSGFKTLAHVAVNLPNGEKQEHNNDCSNSKLSTNNNTSRRPKPRSITDQNPLGGSTPLLEPRPAEENEHRGRRRRGNQKVVREPGDQTPPLARNVHGLSHNDARADAPAVVKESNGSNVSQGTNRTSAVVKESNGSNVSQRTNRTPAVVKESNGSNVSQWTNRTPAVVKEDNIPNASQGINRRGGFGRFHGVPRYGPSKPSFGSKKGQVSLVWVKKGESASN